MRFLPGRPSPCRRAAIAGPGAGRPGARWYGKDDAQARSSPAIGLARGIAARGRARQALDDLHRPATAWTGGYLRPRVAPFLSVLASTALGWGRRYVQELAAAREHRRPVAV